MKKSPNIFVNKNADSRLQMHPAKITADFRGNILRPEWSSIYFIFLNYVVDIVEDNSTQSTTKRTTRM